MNRKILFSVIIVAIAIIGVSSVSAFDLGFLTGSDSENTTVTIDGVDFNVPNGFEEDEDYAFVNESRSQGDVKYVVNGKTYQKDDDVISLLVSDYGDYKVDDSIVSALGGNEKTINDVKGYMSEDDGFYVFSYAKDDKLVVLSASAENIIEDFVMA